MSSNFEPTTLWRDFHLSEKVNRRPLCKSLTVLMGSGALQRSYAWPHSSKGNHAMKNRILLLSLLLLSLSARANFGKGEFDSNLAVFDHQVQNVFLKMSGTLEEADPHQNLAMWSLCQNYVVASFDPGLNQSKAIQSLDSIQLQGAKATPLLWNLVNKGEDSGNKNRVWVLLSIQGMSDLSANDRTELLASLQEQIPGMSLHRCLPHRDSNRGTGGNK